MIYIRMNGGEGVLSMKMKLGHKLLLMFFSIVVVSLSAVTIISIVKSSDSLVDLARVDLTHMTVMARNSCQLAAESSLENVRKDLRVARLVFDDVSRGRVEVREGKMVLDPGGKDVVVNNNYNYVDQIQALTKATCTIFLKEGDQARRISTNVLKKDGSRAIGTYVSQPVYDAVIRSGRTFFGRAWVVTDWYVTAYEPIRDVNNNIVGILYVGVPERTPLLRETLLSQKVGETGHVYCIDSKGVLQVHPAKEGADISNYDFIREITTRGPQLAEGEISWIEYPWANKELGETKTRNKIVAYTYFKDWDWIIVVGSYLDEFTKPASAIKKAILVPGFIFMMISIAMGFLMARSITKPISRLAVVAKAVAVGDISKTVDVKSKDEIGDLALSFNEMMTYLQDNAAVAEKIAGNDLRVSVNPKSDKDVLGNSFRAMTGNLTNIVKQLKDSTAELVSAAAEIASTSEQMSRGSQDQADQVNQVSAAIEEMSATIIQSSKNAGEAKEASKGASETASSGGRIVSDTIQGMSKITEVVKNSASSIEELAKSADQIGEIVSVINDIADQTNLLALNAAIEAARAGEQGRGFAVVADEVRKLAERTARATCEIADMIKGIQKQTNEAVQSMESGINEVDNGLELANKAGSSLTEIVNMSQQVMDMIEQIATATNQQSAASEEISKRVENIASVTKQSSAGAEQAAAAAEELSRQADSLRAMVEQFRIVESDDQDKKTKAVKRADDMRKAAITS
jgi:methyl-accepting chemotaxis protein